MPTVRLKLELENIGQGILYQTTQTIAETEIAWQEFQQATGTTDQAIPFNLTTGITTIDFVLLQSDQAISWRLAAADTAITLDANRIHLLWGTSVTAFLLSNASGSTANIKIGIGG